jgi:ankyrin repeat protein
MTISKKDHSKVFLWACQNGHLEIVKLLIVTPEFNSLNTQDDDRKTPFVWACLRGHLEIVKLLIATPGFNSLNIPDCRGTTPFIWACYCRHLEIAKILIATPGFNSLNTHSKFHETPFYHVCRGNDLKIAKLLIETPGFDSLNTSDEYGRTPFFFACYREHLEILQILLLQDNLRRSHNVTLFSEKVQNIIKEVDANRPFYMKKYKTSLIIDLYRLVVFLSDDYLKIKESSKFFKIIKGLPTELQIKIIFATIKWNQTYILAEDFNNRLKEFIRKIEN